jgi:hypothetical protein
MHPMGDSIVDEMYRDETMKEGAFLNTPALSKMKCTET